MMAAERFVAKLEKRAENRTRVDLADLWILFTELRPDDARAADSRKRLQSLLSEAAAEGLIKPSVSTDGIGPIALPSFVTVRRSGRSNASSAPSPWLPDIGWAIGVNLSTSQRNVLDRVNRWLRDGGADRPVVPAEERSLELFDDEKAIANRIGGAATLWRPGRLEPSLLRYENVPIPFPYRQVGTGERILMVENTAAFRSCARLLTNEPDHPYYAVAFGQGAWAPRTVPAAIDLPVRIAAVDYWGDLDPNGLAIMRDVMSEASKVGLDGNVHETLWRLMLAEDRVPHTSAPRSFDSSLVDLLPADLRPGATEVLLAKCRIPQERVGYEQLARSPAWWRNGS